jgi:hypothetical protein
MAQLPLPMDLGPLKENDKVYILYDARAKYDVDEASVLYSGYSLVEAREAQAAFGPDSVLYEYRLVDGVATAGQPVDEDEETG